MALGFQLGYGEGLHTYAVNTSVLVPTGDMAGPMTPEQAAAAAWMPFAALSRPSPYLLRCLLLAVLLHVWLVLLLGNAPGGTAPRGQGAWGSINITLRGPQSPGATAEQAPPEPLPPSGPAGTAIQPRFGGAVREAGPAPAPEPGAAQLGTWTATPLPFKPSSDLPSAASPTPRVDSNQASSGPPPTQGRVVEERATELPATKPGPIPIPAPPPAPMPAAEPAPTPTAERSLSSNIDRDSNRPTQVQPLNSNPVDNPSLRPLSLPARLPDLAAPLPAAPAVPPPPAPVPTAPPAPPAPAAPPPAATVVAPPTPAAVVEAPSVVRSLSTADTPSAPAAVAPLSRDVEGTAAPSLPPLQRPPAVGPALLAPPGGVAAPNAGPTVGADVATSAAQPASAPRLNLQLNRARGAELSRGASSGVLQLLPRPPDLPNKLAKDIEKTAKPDCKNAYAGAGLLAVVPLLLDAARQDGCKW